MHWCWVDDETFKRECRPREILFWSWAVRWKARRRLSPLLSPTSFQYFRWGWLSLPRSVDLGYHILALTSSIWWPIFDQKNIVSVQACMLSCIQLFATTWTLARQAPLCMGFSRQGYWNRLPFSTPGDLPHQRLNPLLISWVTCVGRLFFFKRLSHLGS